MKRRWRIAARALAVAAAVVLLESTGWSQCAMCRFTLEQSGDGWMIAGVRQGIYLLLAAPAAIVAVIGYGVYRAWRNQPPRPAAAEADSEM